MGAKFGDLADYFDPGLTLKVQGKDYEIPLPSAELGLWCRQIADLSGTSEEDLSDNELNEAADAVSELPALPGRMSFTQRLLGDVYADMVADKVPDPYIHFCAQTVYMWIIGGEELAQRFWEAGGRPEAAGPGNRAQRRANDRKTSTAAATATPSPGSTSGTSSPKRSNGKGRGRGSRGRRS